MRASGSLRGAAAGAVGTGHPGPPARLLQPADRGGGPGGTRPRSGAGRGPARPRGCALLMHDVTPWLVPATDEPIPLAQHVRFLRHMAALHAAFWDCGPEFDVVPAMHRYLELSPWMAQAEAAMRRTAHLVPQLVGQGLAAAGGGRARRRRGGDPAGPRPGPAGGRAGPDAAHVRAQQLEAGQPRHRRRRADRRARLGNSPGWARRSAIWPGTWPSTAAVCRSPRRPRSASTGRRWKTLASTPARGGTGSWPCACSVPWSSSAGRRHSVATTRSWRGGRPRPCRPHPC